jgi:hypothetical protein
MADRARIREDLIIVTTLASRQNMVKFGRVCACLVSLVTEEMNLIKAFVLDVP